MSMMRIWTRKCSRVSGHTCGEVAFRTSVVYSTMRFVERYEKDMCECDTMLDDTTTALRYF